jgi:hypothetical protein
MHMAICLYSRSNTTSFIKSQLGLTKMDIALNSDRPNFLCEQILDVMDGDQTRKQKALLSHLNPTEGFEELSQLQRMGVRLKGWFGISSLLFEDDEGSKMDRSSHSLKGAYLGMQQQHNSEKNKAKSSSTRNVSTNDSRDGTGKSGGVEAVLKERADRTSREMELFEEEEAADDAVLTEMIAENQKSSQLHHIFKEMDADGSGSIDLEEFVEAYSRIHEGIAKEDIEMIFHEADVDGSGELDFEEFEATMNLHGADIIRRLHHAGHRNERGILEVQASTEDYFGAKMHENAPPGIDSFAQAQSQHFSMELYESRIASLQRFTAMCVMFHQMGKRVQDFFPKYSLGLMGYKMERTHSIMRIATTASPVSGDAVREQMQLLKSRAKYLNAVNLIKDVWHRRQHQRMKELLKAQSSRSFSSGLNSSARSLSNSTTDHRVPEEEKSKDA